MVLTVDPYDLESVAVNSARNYIFLKLFQRPRKFQLDLF